MVALDAPNCASGLTVESGSWRVRGQRLSEAQPSPAPRNADFSAHFASIREAVEARLEELSPAIAGNAPRLRRSVRYSLLDGGKRLRPLVTVLTAESLGSNLAASIDVACAIEMVHTASLIIDDLPCMDDAQQRRGKSTNHLIHGEDIALLGAISLISEAFGVVSRAPLLSEQVRLRSTAVLSDAIGVNGLCAGQERDLRELADTSDLESLEALHQQKTGALFVACLETGALIAGLNAQDLEPLREFGRHAGLAFQILDDLLDSLGDEASTGKDHGQDADKHTHAQVIGITEAEIRAEQELDAALSAVKGTLTDTAPFEAFLNLVLEAYRAQAGRQGVIKVRTGSTDRAARQP